MKNTHKDANFNKGDRPLEKELSFPYGSSKSAFHSFALKEWGVWMMTDDRSLYMYVCLFLNVIPKKCGVPSLNQNVLLKPLYVHTVIHHWKFWKQFPFNKPTSCFKHPINTSIKLPFFRRIKVYFFFMKKL